MTPVVFYTNIVSKYHRIAKKKKNRVKNGIKTHLCGYRGFITSEQKGLSPPQTDSIFSVQKITKVMYQLYLAW